MREAGGFRMGPFELMDLIGHDVNFSVTQSVFDAYFNDPRFTPSVLQQEMVNAGFLGRKSGRGFYLYGEGAPAPVAQAEARSRGRNSSALSAPRRDGRGHGGVDPTRWRSAWSRPASPSASRVTHEGRRGRCAGLPLQRRRDLS